MPLLFCAFLLVEAGVDVVDVLFVHLLAGETQAFADTINMKWIRKEPSTLVFMIF